MPETRDECVRLIEQVQLRQSEIKATLAGRILPDEQYSLLIREKTDLTYRRIELAAQLRRLKQWKRYETDRRPLPEFDSDGAVLLELLVKIISKLPDEAFSDDERIIIRRCKEYLKYEG